MDNNEENGDRRPGTVQVTILSQSKELQGASTTSKCHHYEEAVLAATSMDMDIEIFVYIRYKSYTHKYLTLTEK